MKKFYNNPSMNISFFEQENVVTASGDVKSTEKDAQDWLSTQGITRDMTAVLAIF